VSTPRSLIFASLLLSFAGYAVGEDLRLGLGNFGLRATVAPPATTPQLQPQATPFTVWLDFHRLAANRWIPGELPDWLAPVEAETRNGLDGVTTSIRVHLRNLGDSGRDLQFRLFFDDQKDLSPTVAAWSGLAGRRFEYGPLGDSLGLQTSETLTFPTAGIDFIDITVPGDGHNLRGVFLALLEPAQVQRGLDFELPADLVDAFQNLPPIITKAEDISLYGRVRAVIDPSGLKLAPDAATRGTWEFPLQSPPLLAIVTYEILGADPTAPLEVIVNDRPLGASAIHWPDLADPGFLGLARPLERDLRFRYTGWLRAQKIIPGSALRAGANTLSVQLHPDSGAVAIRAVEIQLKYNWKNLDYTLAPATP